MDSHVLIDSALIFAARAHAKQRRKSTDVPYIIHPVGVMMVLVECNETDPELLAAALLHDTVEDTGVTLAEVRTHFGEHVAQIVDGCSEPDKGDTWEHRKEHTIAYLKTAPRDIALVSAADKLHNVRSMVMDYQALGNTLWLRFKRGREQTGWYYRSVLQSFKDGVIKDHIIVAKLEKEVTLLFGPGN